MNFVVYSYNIFISSSSNKVHPSDIYNMLSHMIHGAIQHNWNVKENKSTNRLLQSAVKPTTTSYDTT